MSDSRDDKIQQKWIRIMQKGVETVVREQPDAFIRRVRRGIPTQYRYGSLGCLSLLKFIDGMFGKLVCIVIQGEWKACIINCHRPIIHGRRLL